MSVGGRRASSARNTLDAWRVDSFLRSPRTPVPVPTDGLPVDQAVAPDFLAGLSRRGTAPPCRSTRRTRGQPGERNVPSSRGSTTSSGSATADRLRPASAVDAGDDVLGRQRRRGRDARSSGTPSRTPISTPAAERWRTSWAPKIAHAADVLIEAVVDAALEHRVLDARAQAQARRRAPSISNARAPGGGGVAGGGNDDGPSADGLGGALPHQDGAERRQEQSERQRREPRTHPSVRVAMSTCVSLDP